MIKRKTKNIKRFFAFFGILLCLGALVLPFCSFAAEAERIYDFSILPNANLSNIPQLLNPNYDDQDMLLTSEPYDGSFTFTCDQAVSRPNGRITALQFKDLAPDINVGDIIYISWSTDVVHTYSNQFQWQKSSGAFGDFYTSGTKLQVTNDILNSYLVFYPFKGSTVAGQSITYSQFRVNLDEVKPFSSYFNTLNFKAYTDSVYESAYANGLETGSNSVVSSFNLFTRERLVSCELTYRKANPNIMTEYYDYTSQFLSGYAFDGYTIDSGLFPSSILSSLDGQDKSYFWTVAMEFSTASSDSNGNSLSYMSASELNLGFVVDCFDSIGVKVTTSNGTTYNYGYINESKTLKQNITITNETFGLAPNVSITSVWFEYGMGRKWVDGSTDPIYSDSFPPIYVTTRTHEYLNGYTSGYDSGYNKGYTVGSSVSNDISFNQGKEQGVNEAKDFYYEKGKRDGYTNGYNKGFEEGSDGSTFYNFFTAIIQAPVDVFHSFLNFEIFGVNMSVFASSLITFAVVFAIVRVFI